MTNQQRKFAACARRTRGVKSRAQRAAILRNCLRK